jgi:hypothetical protein
MATDQATESLPDQLASLTRVDVYANRLRMSVDVLLGILRRHDVWLNPGDRVPEQVVYDAVQAELDAGRPWAVERIEWH